MLGERQAVSARNLHTLVLKGADDRLKQLATLAHENQKVAAARCAIVDHLAHGARDAPCELYPRVRFAHGIEWRVPAFDFPLVVGLFRLQTSTMPGGASGNAIWGGKPSVSELTLSATSFVLNTSSTALSTFPPDRNECSNLVTTKACPLSSWAFLKNRSMFGEFLGGGLLERIDRLLFIADRKNRARHVAGPGAGGEFGGQPAHDVPLLALVS